MKPQDSKLENPNRELKGQIKRVRRPNIPRDSKLENPNRELKVFLFLEEG